MPLDVLTFEETLSIIHKAIIEKSKIRHVALNVAKLIKAKKDPVLWRDIVSSDIIGVDGMGIVLAAKLLGIRIPERIAGVDLMEKLLLLCAQERFKPYFLGARQDVVERAVYNARMRWPTLEFAGYRNGYFHSIEELTIVEQINLSYADCLFIGLPTPKKERFLSEHFESLNVNFVMGVGGSLDVLAGLVRRAPPLIQNYGFEWLYRIYQEPNRMWWRYTTTNTVFLSLIAKALVRKQLTVARKFIFNG
ncbi:MAG: WecB/TagA/CpsF family glycosyltransferase [Rhodomicrobium sp.]|nr:WecB/TagA/CpsF family glycosyltransferase [Rhodomicrobium sp.]